MVASSKTKAVSRWLVTATKSTRQPVSTECAFTIFMAELNQKIERTHATFRTSKRRFATLEARIKSTEMSM